MKIPGSWNSRLNRPSELPRDRRPYNVYERLKAWADELRGRLRRRLDARRTKQAIGARAHETSHIDLDQLSAPGMHKEITFIPCSSRQAFHSAKAKRRNAL